MIIPFCGPSYEGRSRNFDSSRCINFFPEVSFADNGKVKMCLVGTPGVKPFCSFTSGNIRLLYNFVGRLFVVVGANLYEVYADGTKSAVIATLNDSTGDIEAADNGIKAYGVGGNQLMMISNQTGYIFNVETGVLSVIPVYDSLGNRTTFPLYPSTVTYQDGYFIVSDDSMAFYVSDLYDGMSWPALATSAVIATPDPIQKVLSLVQQLYIIKSWSTEIWYNSGTPTYQGNPFSRSPGYVFPFGTPAPKSIAYGLDTIFFLANQGHSGASEFSGVTMLQGSTPMTISTPPINYKISRMDTISDARGYFYLDEGHSFYVLTFPSADTTFTFDLSTKLWHERSTSSLTDDFVHRHLSDHYTHFSGKHIVSDYRNPVIYDMSSQYYSDDGLPIISTRITQSISDKKNDDSVFIRRLIVDAETGVGDETTIEPVAFLSWSNDDGHTWSNRYQASLGKRGNYVRRLVWRNLGRARNKVFKLTISDPVKKVIIGAYVNDGIQQ